MLSRKPNPRDGRYIEDGFPECTDIPDPKADSVFKVPAFNRQEFVYTYNDGDEWRFTVIIESVTPEAPTKMGVIA